MKKFLIVGLLILVGLIILLLISINKTEKIEYTASYYLLMTSEGICPICKTKNIREDRKNYLIGKKEEVESDMEIFLGKPKEVICDKCNNIFATYVIKCFPVVVN